VKFRRVWAMPSADTFSIGAIGDLVKSHLKGVSVDPFARNKRWATYTNDLNQNTQAEYHMDAVAFLAMLADQGVKADVVLFDPPYSPRQISECYAEAGLTTNMKSTQSAVLYAECRAQIRRLLREGGTVISFGWNSTGMGEGFTKHEIMLVCHGGAHNDTICVVETFDGDKQADIFTEAA
jgi:23S rRNA G2069 N7-methylase RlmK/C1962 C5-methylase RlmI